MKTLDSTTVFVIIVTFLGKKWYDRCFLSLRESTIPIHIVVIDNASNDGSVEYICSTYPEVVLIESKENLGFGQANNIGMKYALEHGADYLFLLNQDTAIEPDSIKGLVSLHSKHPEYGILSPMHLTGDMNHLNILFFDGKPRPNYHLINDLFFGRIQDIYDESYINAAAWLIPRSVLLEVGGFCPLFRHYEEDDDYLNRVAYHGFRIGLCPKIRIIHDHTNLDNPFLRKNERYLHEQQLLVDLVNINKPDRINNRLRSFLRNSIYLVFKGRIADAKSSWLDFKYILSQKHTIRGARKENIKSQPSWL